MLAKIGIKIDLLAQTKSKYFAKVLPQAGNMTSMYLLGWSPSSVDADNVLINLVHCPDKPGFGQFNFGHYCNKDVDALETQIGAETDQAKRNALIKKAFTMVHDDYAYMTLHQQPLSWGVKSSIQVAQRPDDVLDLRNVVMP
jgi:peptide/nickel transport system substrate-binding protein